MFVNWAEGGSDECDVGAKDDTQLKKAVFKWIF